MKRILLTLIALCSLALSGTAQDIYGDTRYRQDGDNDPRFGAQQRRKDTGYAADSIDTSTIPIGLKVWHIDPRFGGVIAAMPDTLPHLFQNDCFTEGRTGQYNTTGNLGAPRHSRVWHGEAAYDMLHQPFVFALPYDFFLRSAQQLLFTNTKSPITNITYHECGNKTNGEDRITALFATNVNRRLGFGFNIDYLYGRGYYQQQSTSQFAGRLYGSYNGEHYQLHAYYDRNHLKTTENGGLRADSYITDPQQYETQYATLDMPVRLSKAWNKYDFNTLFLTHRYNIGYHALRDADGQTRRRLDDSAVAAGQDPMLRDTTLTRVFVPVASFIHTFRWGQDRRRLLLGSDSSDYFAEEFIAAADDRSTDDTRHTAIENTLALEMQEGFKPWVKTGMRLFAKHEYQRFTLPDETFAPVAYNENYITLGAQLMKQQGRYFHYDVLGEMRTSGKQWGEFGIEGKVDGCIPVGKDTITITASGLVRNQQPSFYYRHLHGRYVWWDNDDLRKTFHTRIAGDLRWRDTRLTVALESLKDYTYFAETISDVPQASALPRYGATVRQASGSVQVLTATLRQDFVVGPLHWENELTYQHASDESVLPLPTFTGWTNLYFLFRIARVLRTELGADLHYFTKYKALAYSPLIGQYAVQDAEHAVEVGNYPWINVYLNFHLKNTRFYVMASHINGNSSKGGHYFLVPHYPTNRMIIRFGVSWNFFN
ncbi:MAG: putative porin [Bacteroidales bacterium]|nr:putative porin [Candidatus Equimonas enterica]